MPEKFCYKCGALEKDKGPLIEGLCRDCFRTENPLIKIPDEIELEICKECGAYLIGNTSYDVERDPASEYLEAAKELVSSKMEVLEKGPTGSQYVSLKDSENVDVSFEAEYESSEMILVKIGIQVKSFDTKEPLTDDYEIRVKFADTTCEICKKRKSGYYEAVLQVRGEEELPEGKLSEIFQSLRSEFMKLYGKDRGEFVSQIKRKHGGINLYLSSSKSAEDLARFLKNGYGANMEKSAELIGQTDDGREKYRVTIVSRIPSQD